MSTYEELGVCPGCEAGMPPHPVLSLLDNATAICQACGAFEAQVLANGGRLDAPGFEWTGNRIEPTF